MKTNTQPRLAPARLWRELSATDSPFQARTTAVFAMCNNKPPSCHGPQAALDICRCDQQQALQPTELLHSLGARLHRQQSCALMRSFPLASLARSRTPYPAIPSVTQVKDATSRLVHNPSRSCSRIRNDDKWCIGSANGPLAMLTMR
ncbi:hypothetical protein ACCO45_013171 [Purpureocillium lilacinum]|uniref:Uncharacterized protein n=1 Tax=Purpureocillium lilacinum TaxID=33203 RepID=A0ACC4DD43_PURLI